MATTNSSIPIAGLFEAHLAVSNLDRAVSFYRDKLGLMLAARFDSRQVAFFWMGGAGHTLLGLWEAGTMPVKSISHIAFRASLDDLLTAPSHLKSRGIEPRGFDGNPTDEPIVICWMPAASVFFHDPDGNLLEYISMLPQSPRPELGVIRWSDWLKLRAVPR